MRKQLPSLDAPRAKKSLGQNFLQDRNIARKIVDSLHIDPGDPVLEIGPGPGALTGFIAERNPGRLLLVEKDDHWAGERQKALPGAEVFNVDALEMDWERFTGSWKCIGNLPYNVASPLMWELFSRMRAFARAVFMIQKEVGQRIVAKPGTGAYGALSVWMQTFTEPKLEFIVPPQVFYPRPKIDSAVLSFEPQPSLPSQEESRALASVLRLCFQQRRKQLGTILKNQPISEEDLPEGTGISFTLRPEQLTPGQFLLLAKIRYSV